jgi:hypothetical protein
MSWAFGCAFAFTNRTYPRDYPGGGRTEACFPSGPMIQRALSLPIWRILNPCAKTKFRCVIAITSGCGLSNLLFLPTIVFKCASQNCRRYYGRRYGYFDLLPIVPPSLEQFDPANRCMKVCTRRQTHS